MIIPGACQRIIHIETMPLVETRHSLEQPHLLIIQDASKQRPFIGAHARGECGDELAQTIRPAAPNRQSAHMIDCVSIAHRMQLR